MLALVVTTIMALVVGWLAGMLTRQRASHWCPHDGAQLTCPECSKAGLHVLRNGGRQRNGLPGR